MIPTIALVGVGRTVAMYAAVFVLPFLIALGLTPLVRELCRRLGMLDCPSARRIHTRATPRGGGIAIFIAFHAACAIWLLSRGTADAQEHLQRWWTGCLPASLVLLLVGIVDDRFNLRPGIKLLGQVLASAMAVALGLRIHSIMAWPLPLWLDAPLTILALVAVVNAFNLIDGIDGLATGLAILASLGLAGAFLLQRDHGSAMVALILAGACAGFIGFNFHPASVFLGDSGSMFLGFTLAAIAMTTSNKATALATFGVPLLAFGVPLLDTLLAIWRRAVRKRLMGGAGKVRFGDGDVDHLHHRLARRGLTQRRVALLLYAVNAVAIVAGLAMMAWRENTTSIFLLAFIVGGYIVFRHLAHVETTESGQMVVDGIRRPSWRKLPVLIYPVVDVVGMTAAMAIGLLHHVAIDGHIRFVHLQWGYPFLVCIPFLALAAVRTYSRVWSRARISEFFLAGVAAFAGVAFGAAVLNLFLRWSPAKVMGMVVTTGSLSAVAVVSVRAFPRFVMDAMGWARCQRLAQLAGARRVLVYGAGFGYTLLLRAESYEPPDSEARHIVVGLIDDEPNLRGRFVYGHPVLGGIEDLERIVGDRRVDKLIISTELPDQRSARVIDICARRGVEVCRWEMGLRPVVPGPPRPHPL